MVLCCLFGSLVLLDFYIKLRGVILLRSFRSLPKVVKAYFIRYRLPDKDFPFEFHYGNYVYTFWCVDLPVEVRLECYSCKRL